jgi:thiamine-phosphate pyrophosphorylase
VRPGFEKPIVYLITTGSASERDIPNTTKKILATVRLAVDEQISLVQIREKQLSARSLFELTSAAAAITRGSATRLLVNDRADIALSAKADGVHLTATSLSAKVIRETFPTDFIIGASVHSIETATNAAKEGADLVVFGPVFDTPGKGRTRGLAELSAICETLSPFPVIGLGGIDETNFESVIAAGASGIAAIRLLNDHASMRAVSRKLRK